MEEKTLPEMFWERVKKYSDNTVLRKKKDGKWIDISWNEFGNNVRNFALGLISLKIEKGDKVSILSWNRPEWVFADLGILSAGGVPVSIYASNLPREVGYIIGHSESKIVIVENEEQLNKVLQVRDELPTFLPLAHALERIVFYLSIYFSGIINFAENINTIAQNILEVKPRIMIGVPRVFEKIYNGIITNVESSSKFKRKIFYWSVKVGKIFSELKINKKIFHFFFI